MPTLMTTVLDGPLRNPAPSLTLTLSGVEFTLAPSDNSAELSYKMDSTGVVTISLDNFSGTLRAFSKPGHPESVASTSAPLSQTVKVVDEPDSPEGNAHYNTEQSPRTNSGQQKLTFHHKPGQTKTTAKKKSTGVSKRVRAGSSSPLSSSSSTSSASHTTKKARRDASNKVSAALDSTISNNGKNNKSQRSLTTLCQTMDPDQEMLTQETPNFPQSMPTDQSGRSDISATPLFRCQSTASELEEDNSPAKESIQEILDRVNSSEDSVATVPGDDNEDFNDDASYQQTSHENTNSKEVAKTKKTVKSSTAKATTSNMLSIKQSKESDENAMNLSNPDQESLTPTSSPSPCPRWGHTMTQLKDHRLLVYGGQSFDTQGNPTILSDVHIYNTVHHKWDKPINCRGEARQWHSATFLPERQLLLVFGGETMDTAKKNKVITTDSLKVLDTDIMLWYPPAVSGDIPTGRSGHTATLIPTTNEVVLFGGVKGSKWLNTVNVLDTVRWIWTTPKIQGAAPKPRSYHSATAVPHGNSFKLVIFGGNNKTSCFNSVHVLELLEDRSWKWSNPSVEGVPPFPRTGHSATLLDDKKTICIYGGWDPNEDPTDTDDNIFKSSFYLDTESWKWSTGPKAHPGGSGTDDSTLDNCGAQRCGHTSSLNPETGEILLFGGRIPGEILAGDFQRLANIDRTK